MKMDQTIPLPPLYTILKTGVIFINSSTSCHKMTKTPNEVTKVCERYLE